MEKEFLFELSPRMMSFPVLPRFTLIAPPSPSLALQEAKVDGCVELPVIVTEAASLEMIDPPVALLVMIFSKEQPERTSEEVTWIKDFSF